MPAARGVSYDEIGIFGGTSHGRSCWSIADQSKQSVLSLSPSFVEPVSEPCQQAGNALPEQVLTFQRKEAPPEVSLVLSSCFSLLPLD